MNYGYWIGRRAQIEDWDGTLHRGVVGRIGNKWEAKLPYATADANGRLVDRGRLPFNNYGDSPEDSYFEMIVGVYKVDNPTNDYVGRFAIWDGEIYIVEVKSKDKDEWSLKRDRDGKTQILSDLADLIWAVYSYEEESHLDTDGICVDVALEITSPRRWGRSPPSRSRGRG